jgi:hypothetical protein
MLNLFRQVDKDYSNHYFVEKDVMKILLVVCVASVILLLPF